MRDCKAELEIAKNAGGFRIGTASTTALGQGVYWRMPEVSKVEVPEAADGSEVASDWAPGVLGSL
jgi:hypothetical protein